MIELECIQLKNEVEQAFIQFAAFLQNMTFPSTMIDDYMFMGNNDGCLGFKHIMSRNYIYISELNQKSVYLEYMVRKDDFKYHLKAAILRFELWLDKRHLDKALISNFVFIDVICNHYCFMNKYSDKPLYIPIESSPWNE